MSDSDEEAAAVEEADTSTIPTVAGDAPAGDGAPPGLSMTARHVFAFAPAGLIDLSERSLRTQFELDVFGPKVLTPEIAAGIWQIDFTNNGISAIPPSMTRPLSGVRELFLAHNALTAFPPALCLLPSLETLDLSLNLLEAIDVSGEMVAKGMPRLTTLLVSRNRLTRIPAFLAQCTCLTSLDLGHNRLGFAVTIASDDGDATAADPLAGTFQLRQLSLNDNGLLNLPHSIYDLAHLVELNVAGNRLALLPAKVGALAHTLELLDLSHNSLRALPPQLGDCAKLTSMDASHNPLQWPPANVMSSPLPRILSWLREHAHVPEVERSPRALDDAAMAAAAEAAEAKRASEARVERVRAEAAALKQSVDMRVEALRGLRTQSARAKEAASSAEGAAASAAAILEKRREEIKARMSAEEKQVEAAAARVASIPKRHLEELARFTNPPPAVQNTLTAVHLLLEASEQSDKPAAAQKLGMRSAMQAASMVSLPAVGRELARAGRESSRSGAGGKESARSGVVKDSIRSNPVKEPSKESARGSPTKDSARSTRTQPAHSGGGDSPQSARGGGGSMDSARSRMRQVAQKMSSSPSSARVAPAPPPASASSSDAASATAATAATTFPTPPPPPTPLAATSSKGRSSAGSLARRVSTEPPASASGGSGMASAYTAPTPWEAVRGTLQRNFVQRVSKFDARKVSAAMCTAVRAALPQGDDALESVSKASVACAPLWTWAHASLELADSMHAATTGEGDVERLEVQLALQRGKETSAKAEAQALGRRLLEVDAEMRMLRSEAEAAAAEAEAVAVEEGAVQAALAVPPA